MYFDKTTLHISETEQKNSKNVKEILWCSVKILFKILRRILKHEKVV